jgi:hypothetical protein
MIRIQPSSSGSNHILIGSDLKDRGAARREVDQWIAGHRCRVAKTARHLSVFDKGVAVREWVLVERLAEPEAPLPQQAQPQQSPLADLPRPSLPPFRYRTVFAPMLPTIRKDVAA